MLFSGTSDIKMQPDLDVLPAMAMAGNPICAHWGLTRRSRLPPGIESPTAPLQDVVVCMPMPADGPRPERWAATSHHACWKPPASNANNGAGDTRRACGVSQWLGGDEMVHAHSHRPPCPGGGAPSAMLCAVPPTTGQRKSSSLELEACRLGR